MQRSFFILAIGTVAAFTGCGSTTGPETAMVAGTVYLDGKPAAEVDVNFMNGSYAAFGRTNEQGQFQLVTGAAVGANKVYFSKISGGLKDFKFAPEEGMDEGQLMAMRDPGVKSAGVPKQLIPEQYSDPAKTKVSLEVPDAGVKDADFRLQSR